MELICIENIDKSFGKGTQIFKDFSYSFQDKGFYLLFGTSGCGKTTLLNIICGLEKADSGQVVFNGQGDIISNISYITQDTYYVDYLTVIDNLKMAAVDMSDDEIRELAADVGISERLDAYPDELSGGEKQRLAIVRAMVQKRGVLILDEPTAALDKENTAKLLKMLENLKNEILIIATSHDKSFRDYADYIIDFHKLKSGELSNEKIHIEKTEEVERKNKIKNPGLKNNDNKSLWKTIKWMNKEGRYKKREKKSFVYLVIFFVISLLVSNFFFDIANKFDRALLERYKVNRCLVYVDKEKVDSLNECDGVVRVDYIQGTNTPYAVEIDGEYVDSFDWFESGDTLPGDEKLFPYVNEIQYGTYFTKENQVILGYEYVQSYYSGEPETLIGKKINLNPLDGDKEYEIVGIFRKLSEEAESYFLQACSRQPDNECYFNGNDMECLKKHPWSEMQCATVNGERYSGRIAVYVYFEDLLKLKEFYNQNQTEYVSDYTVAKMPGRLVDDVTMYTNLERYAEPVKYVIILFAVLFFFQTKLMEMNYHSSILAVYDYNGYKKWKIRVGYMMMQMKKVVLCIFTGSVLSVVLSFVFNQIDKITKLCPFVLFEVDIKSMIILSSIMLVASVVMSFITGLTLNVTGWFSLLKKNRDLL